MDPFSLRYSDGNERKTLNTFNNIANNRHGLKKVTCKQNFILMNETSKIKTTFSV